MSVSFDYKSCDSLRLTTVLALKPVTHGTTLCHVDTASADSAGPCVAGMSFKVYMASR